MIGEAEQCVLEWGGGGCLERGGGRWSHQLFITSNNPLSHKLSVLSHSPGVGILVESIVFSRILPLITFGLKILGLKKSHQIYMTL